MSEQTDWRFCHKCSAMYFDGFPTKGVCVAGGGHEPAGFNFVLPHDIPGSPNAQPDWRFCKKCELMFFDGFSANKGVCKTGNGHEEAGFNFVLPHDIPDSPTQQSLWRFCQKCNAIYFNGFPLNPDGSESKGLCAAGGGHEEAGFIFVLPHDTHPTIQLADEGAQVRASGAGFTPGATARINYSHKNNFGGVTTTSFGDPTQVRIDNSGRFSGVVLRLTLGSGSFEILVQATDTSTNLQADSRLR